MLKNRKQIKKLVAAGLLAALLGGCTPGTSPQGTVETPVETPGESLVESPGEAAAEASAYQVEYTGKDLEDQYDPEEGVLVTFSADQVSAQGEGITVEGATVTLTQGGLYVLTGSSATGHVVVAAGEEDDVVLLLQNLTLENTEGVPVNIQSADKVILHVLDGTSNTLSDGGSTETAAEDSDAPNAAVYSKADLTINGTGKLVVEGSSSHGVFSKDDLKIIGTDLQVTAVHDGIKGKDLVGIKEAKLTVNAGDDALVSSNEEDSTKGFVVVESGVLNLTAGADGIQAETGLIIKNGEMTITTGGGSANASTQAGWGAWGTPEATGETSDSAKGLKAKVLLQVDGGTLHIDSSDDSLHSNGDLVINGGTVTIASGDDGIHADKNLTVNGGDITIEKSYEGLEGGVVTVNGGNLHVGASDDGVNTSGGNDGSSLGGRPGQNMFASDGSSFTMTDGYLYVEADGDGVDSNGSISMSGGTLLVSGPTSNGNGALDYNGDFTLTGGTLLALGSSGMAQSAGSSSTQNTVMVNTEALSPGTVVTLMNSSGEELVTFTSPKTFSSLVYSSSLLEQGETYTLSTGGTPAGTLQDLLYPQGTASSGTELLTFTQDEVLVTQGEGGMTGPGGAMPGLGGGMPNPGKRN